jgi:hypothetical protein
MLKRELIPGLIVLATPPLIWAVGQFATHAPRSGPRPGGCTATVTVMLVAVLAVIAALLGHGPASLRQLLHVEAAAPGGTGGRSDDFVLAGSSYQLVVRRGQYRRKRAAGVYSFAAPRRRG